MKNLRAVLDFTSKGKSRVNSRTLTYATHFVEESKRMARILTQKYLWSY